MLTVSRLRRNHPFIHGIVLVVLLSWLGLLVSAACVMPWPLQASATAMADCPADRSDSHPGHLPKPDCAYKPCLASPTGPGFVSGLDRLEPPPGVPWLVVLIVFWFHPSRSGPLAHPPDAPPGRRIPLIYRFCTLLN